MDTDVNLRDRAARIRQLAETGIYESFGRAAEPIESTIKWALRDEVPIDTSHMHDTIDSKQYTGYGGGLSLVFSTAADYAMYVISGTRPHDIFPVNAKALAFYSRGGDLVFARRVHHPGTRPNPFNARAWESSKSDVMGIMRDMGRSIAQVMAA